MGASHSRPSRYFSPIRPLLSPSDSSDAPTSASPYFVLVIRPPRALVLLYSDAQIQSIIGRRLRKECKHGPTSPVSPDGRLMNDGTFEFPLKLSSEQAWSGGNLKRAQLFCRLLADLHTHGWKLAASSELCRACPRSTLFFRRHQRDLVDAAATMIGISAGSSDVIRLIDVPDQLSASLTTAVENAPQIWSNVRIVGQEIGAGHSSAPSGGEGRTRRFIELVPSENDDQMLLLTRVLLKVFSHVYENGFDFYGAVDIDGGADLLLFDKSGGTATQRPSQHFFAIDLVGDNVLRVINAPARLRQTFVNCVDQHWQHGMSTAQSPEPGVDAYALNGQPWTSGTTTLPSGSFLRGDGQVEEALRARRFLSAMFELLSEKLCRLVASVQLNRVSGGTSTFIFTMPSSPVDSGAPASRIHRNAWCCSLMSTSTIFLVNAFFLHRGSFQKLKDDLRFLLARRWPLGLRLGDEEYGFRQYRLNGLPWHTSAYQPLLTRFRQPINDHGPNEDLHARGLICAVLAVMEMRGHELVCTASVSAKREDIGGGATWYKSDCDTWFWVETETSARRPVSSAAHSMTQSLLGIRPSGQAAPSAPVLASAPTTHPVLRPGVSEVAESNPPPYPVEAPPPAYRTVSKRQLFS